MLLFCWYWLNYWSSLFKLPFYNIVDNCMCIFYLEELATPWTFRQLPSFILISYPVQIKRVSGCCSTPNDQFFSHITVKTVLFFQKWWWCPLFSLAQYTELDFIAQWNNSPQGHIILFPCQPVIALNVVCLAGKQRIPIL